MTLKVLINSYTCCPGMGSEPGMGWNWITSLAHYCEIFVITEGEFRPQIESWLNDPANETVAKNLHFYWNPVSDAVRKMCWNQGDWRFYKYYKDWQKSTADIARKVCLEHQIDILHQLNMIGFREPGYLWKVSQETGIPFVWGPIGGLKQFPMAYAKGAGLKMRLFNAIKNKINSWQIAHDSRVSKALHQASVLISSIPDSYKAIKKYHNLESKIIPETGCFIGESFAEGEHRFKGETFNILWVGKFDFRKRLDIALAAIAHAANTNIVLKVYGTGNENQVADAKDYAKRLGILDSVQFMGNRPNANVVSEMRSADLFLFTSISEDTSTVVLEAVSNHLPVVCFDTCGMSEVINDSVGIKIPLTTPEQSAIDFAEAIKKLNANRNLLKEMSENCAKRAQELSWENKALAMIDLYQKSLHK